MFYRFHCLYHSYICVHVHIYICTYIYIYTLEMIHIHFMLKPPKNGGEVDPGHFVCLLWDGGLCCLRWAVRPGLGHSLIHMFDYSIFYLYSNKYINYNCMVDVLFEASLLHTIDIDGWWGLDKHLLVRSQFSCAVFKLTINHMEVYKSRGTPKSFILFSDFTLNNPLIAVPPF